MDLDRQAKIFKALGDPTRLKIVRLLCGGERCVCEIIPATGKTQPTVSIHLKILTEAGLLTHRKKGLSVYYNIKNPQIKKLLSTTDKLKQSNKYVR